MSNQDPMSPSDPTEFVAQLTQFSSLEQLIGVRESLDLVAVTQTAGTSAQMVGFIGKEVRYDGGQLTVDVPGDAHDLRYRLDGAAESATVRVFNAQGDTLREIELGAQERGPGEITFDGLDEDGAPLVAGEYQVELIASDGDGNDVSGTMTATGTVSAITFEAGYPELVLADGSKIGLGQVLQVLGEGDEDDAALTERTLPGASGDDESDD